MSVQCPNHPDIDLIEDHRAGDLVCPACGLVVGDRLVDVGTEWRSFSNEKTGNDPSRVGAPENPLLGAGDLSTSISTGFGSSDSDNILAKAQRRTINGSDRQMIEGIGLIREMSERCNASRTIQERACRRFKEALDIPELRGKNIHAKAAACLYIACREEGFGRTFKEICAVCSVPMKKIANCFKIMKQNQELKLEMISSSDYISRWCALLGLPFAIQTSALRIVNKAKEMDVVAGRAPTSIAAAAIYMASQATSDKRTAKEVGEITGAAESTIKDTYKDMYPKAIELFPEGFGPVEFLPAL